MGGTMDVNDTLASILAGKADGHLVDIMHAIASRAQSDDVTIGWRIEFDGLEITEENQTLGEVVDVQRITGKGWGEVDPINSPLDLQAILVAGLIERTGKSGKQAAEIVSKLNAETALACLSQYEIVRPPKAEDEASTPTTS